MNEPTHTHESQFWDQVADWLLEARGIDMYLSVDEIELSPLDDANQVQPTGGSSPRCRSPGRSRTG